MTGDRAGVVGRTFERNRHRLVRLAYRMCGSWADAEDIVQSVAVEWLRAHGTVRSDEGWLTTVTVRRAVDALRRRQRENTYVGPWLPEPVGAPAQDPVAAAEGTLALTTAFLVMAEELTPPQRAVVVLRALGYEHPEVADILGVTSAASRQHHSRALRRLHALNGRDAEGDPTLGLSHPPGAADAGRTGDLLAAFLRAARAGDVARLSELLHLDVAAYQDGGGRTRAARRILRGRSKVARFVVGIAALHGARRTARLVTVGGAPGLLVTLSGSVHVVSVQVRDGLILRLFDVCNPDKVGRWARPPGPSGLERRRGQVGGDADPVPQVDRADGQDEIRQLPLGELPGRVRPHLVVHAGADTGDLLGQP